MYTLTLNLNLNRSAAKAFRQIINYNFCKPKATNH